MGLQSKSKQIKYTKPTKVGGDGDDCVTFSNRKHKNDYL